MNSKGVLFIVSGPSGVGKGAIVKGIVEMRSDVYLSVSATTRKMRTGEVEGVNYYYKTNDEFQSLIDQNELLEWAVFCNNYYGTPRDKISEKLDSGINVILEIDVQGAMQVRAKHPEGVYIFIVPPSMDILKQRIIDRGTETKEQMTERFSKAKNEFQFADKYNYVIINDKLNQAISDLDAVITAEGLRMTRCLENIKNKFI